MMIRMCLLVGGLLALTIATAFAQSTTPMVVATTPTLGAREVDPARKELAVRFDQPMSDGAWSWCGGGESFPEVVDKPYYRDNRTAVLPVKLKPEHSYLLSINCPSAQNFKSVNGHPAEITLLRFTTGPGDDFITAEGENHEAWQEFRRLFRERYSYYERTGTDWEALFDENESWVLRAPTVDEWLSRMAQLLRRAQDPHLYFRNPAGERFRLYSHGARINANSEAIERAFGGVEKHNRLVWTARRGRIGYIAVHGWNNRRYQMEIIPHLMGEMREKTDALIVDVRANGGGDELQARNLAGWFLEEDSLYAKHRLRDPEEPGGWSDIDNRWVRTNPPEQRYDGAVFVLQGPVCLSSNEAFLLMMRQAPRATSLGATSGGSSANPRPWPLPNGAEIVLPRWQTLRPDGTPWEGEGLAPDIAVDGQFRTRDEVLDKALELAEETLEGD